MSTGTKRSGISILELMIITVILGILALAVVPRVEAYRREVHRAELRQEAASVAETVARYHRAHGTFEGLDTATRAGSGVELAYGWLKADGVWIRAEHPEVPGWACHVSAGAVPLEMLPAADRSPALVMCLEG